MKICIPLIALCLTNAGLAETSTWETLIKIGDEISVDRGQIALVVSVSEPIYLKIDQPQQSSRGLRLRPSQGRQYYYTRSTSDDYMNRRTQIASWNKPFPISGPCTIRLGTSAVMTVRIISTNQG